MADIHNNIPIFQQMIIFYHLEMETRFSTIFQMLKILFDENLNDIQEEALYQTREICSRNSINLATNEQCHYQNIIYFGMAYYIETLTKCCLINKADEVYSPMYILDPMYEIVKLIYVIKDTIMDRLKKAHIEDYNNFINDTFENLQSTFGVSREELSRYENMLLNELERIIAEYNSFHSYDIKVEHFVRMYVSDDKFNKFQMSEIEKKKKKAEQRKTKNKKSYS